MAGPQGRLVLLLSLLFTFVCRIFSKLATGTIDDGESVFSPGNGISFLPAKNGHWNDGAACTNSSPFCLRVETSRAFGQTWTATALYQTAETRLVSIDFVGDGISVFFTLVDTGPRNLSTFCNFALDKEPPELYRHSPTESDVLSFIYQANTFSRTGLKHGAHKLTIIVPSSVQEGNYLNFDYAQYSYDDELPLQPSTPIADPTTTVYIYSSETGNSVEGGAGSNSNKPSDSVLKVAIIGGSISGVVVVSTIVLFLVYRSRQRKRQRAGDRLAFGVPSAYAGSTRKSSLTFWPHRPAYEEHPSNFRILTTLPEKKRSGSSYPSSPHEKYEPEVISSPSGTSTEPQSHGYPRNRVSILSPARALVEAFYPRESKRGSTTTGKLSRLEDSLSPTSDFPRQLSRFSDLRGHQDSDAGSATISSSNHVLPLQTPPSSAGRQSYI